MSDVVDVAQFTAVTISKEDVANTNEQSDTHGENILGL